VRFKEYKYFEKDGMGDGTTYEADWTPKEDRIIHRIYIARKDGKSFTDSTFYFKVDGTVYTLDVVPCIVLGPDMLTNPVLDISIKAKETMEFTFKNLEGESVDVMITFELYVE